ncbi:hypothetical protein MAV_2136 [Mycobacterium avium 104]|uniref:Uncharacterized protein n=1 Tax=Mycobacterium avium (strain 104) TaxID=243243 RepID=A0A0H3A0L7_MYCA1|nr:hypothetical protein MAV_2136 [Mycobacterium avium 104]
MLGYPCGLGDFACRGASVVLPGKAGPGRVEQQLARRRRGAGRIEAGAAAAPRLVDGRWATWLSSRRWLTLG